MGSDIARPRTDQAADSAAGSPSPSMLLGRLDRLPRSAVRWAATGILGAALFVVFYCNFNINVSFIQTCTQIQPGCTPENAGGAETLPVVLYLAGYLLGGIAIAPISDRLGRRALVSGGLLFAVVGSLITALAGGYATFVAGRGITGVAMGIMLAVANTYIGELAPPSARARYTAITFVLCTIGATAGIWMGLLLTTEPAPFPSGLSFALAGAGFDAGWRWIYWIAVIIGGGALVASRFLPESPRWLIEHDRLERAAVVIERLEVRARRRGPLAEPVPAPVPQREEAASQAYRDLFTDRTYRRRIALLIAMWFFGYATVFAFSTSSTSILTGLHFTAPVAGMISAVGGFGFFVQGLFSARWSEKLERRYWPPVGAALTFIGCVLIALLGSHIGWAFIGSFLVFFGFNVWVPPAFALSAESFPTRTRSAGFGLVDGLGVSGGMVGILVIAPLVPHLSPLPALVLVSAFLIVSAIISQFAPRARNRALEELSP